MHWYHTAKFVKTGTAFRRALNNIRLILKGVVDMKKTYTKPEVELANASNDIVATSSFVETGRIPFSVGSAYSEINVIVDDPEVANYNVRS